MQSIKRMMLTMTAISLVIIGLTGCSSVRTEAPAPEATQLPGAESSLTQEQGAADTPDIPDTSTSKESPAPETASKPGVGPQVGKFAPGFSFTNPGGKSTSLTDLRGRSVMLNFWATWCGPCKVEMPLIQELAHDKEKAAEGLVLLTVNGGESADEVTRFMNKYGFSFPVLLDTHRGIIQAYNVRAIPTTFFIDRDGIIRDIKVGAFSSEGEIDSRLNIILD